MDVDWQNIASLCVSLLMIPVFIVLAIPLIVSIIYRIYNAISHEKQHTYIILTMLLGLVFLIYQIISSIILGLRGYYGDTYTIITLLRNLVPYFHFILFTLLSCAYVWVLIKVSVIFDLSLVTADAVVNGQVPLLRRVAVVMRGISIFVAIITTILFFIATSIICVIDGLYRYGVIAREIAYPILIIFNVLFPTTMIAIFSFLLGVFTIIFVIVLYRQNRIMGKSQGSSLPHQRYMMRNRRDKIIRYTLGWIIFFTQGNIILYGLIWHVIRMDNASPFEDIMNDICVRVVPSIIFILGILIVFWPFKNADMSCYVYISDSTDEQPGPPQTPRLQSQMPPNNPSVLELDTVAT